MMGVTAMVALARGTPGQGQRGLWDVHMSSEDRKDAGRGGKDLG